MYVVVVDIEMLQMILTRCTPHDGYTVVTKELTMTAEYSSYVRVHEILHSTQLNTTPHNTPHHHHTICNRTFQCNVLLHVVSD
jgi:hypothetical protein